VFILKAKRIPKDNNYISESSKQIRCLGSISKKPVNEKKLSRKWQIKGF
jgi:hypothetical protein